MDDENTIINNENNADIEEIARRCVMICEEKKASNILLFDVRENSILADYFLVCSGNSMAHIRALSENLRRTLISEGFKPRGHEGTPASQWIVLDFGLILIHIMTPEMRRHYCLEDLWDKRLIVYQGGEELPAASIPADDDDVSYGQWDEDDEDEEEWEDEDDWEDDENEEDWDEDDEEDDDEEEGNEDEDDADDEDEDGEDEEDDWDEDDWDEDDWDEDDEEDDDEDDAHAKPKKDGGITPKDIFGDDDDEEDEGSIKIPVTKK